MAANAAQATPILIGSDVLAQLVQLCAMWWVESVFGECLPLDTRSRTEQNRTEQNRTEQNRPAEPCSPTTLSPSATVVHPSVSVVTQPQNDKTQTVRLQKQPDRSESLPFLNQASDTPPDGFRNARGAGYLRPMSMTSARREPPPLPPPASHSLGSISESSDE